MFKFKHPFTCIISGPTQSGKTHFTIKLLQNIGALINPPPKQVFWCHGQDQKYKGMPNNVTVIDGLPEVDQLVNGTAPTLIVIDDLMQEGAMAKSIADLFTKGSHHKNLSVIMLIQNLFHQGKFMRTMSLNTHYMVLFKNPRDVGQIYHLGSQLFPGKTDYLVDAYKQATERAHGYLVLDFTQSTSDQMRVLSDILPGEGGYYYAPK
jgi:hypothetical protein